MGYEEYTELVATCAMVSTMGQMLSGTFICKDIYKKGTSKGFDPMPFIGGIAMCTIMLRYAFIVQDSTMINVNLFGIATNVAYMTVFYLYTPDKSDILATMAKATAFVAIVVGYAQVENKEHLEFRYGVLTTVLFLSLIASPLLHLSEIIRTKSTEILPFPLIFTGTLVSFQWLVYGILINNAFIILQNAIGFILSFIQLSLFAIYPSTPANQSETSEKKKN